MHQRMGLNSVFKAFREVLIEVLSFGFGVTKLVLVHLLAVLLVNRLSFVHSVVYDANKQAHNQDTKDKSLSETHKIQSKVFEWVPNGMVETELRDTW